MQGVRTECGIKRPYLNRLNQRCVAVLNGYKEEKGKITPQFVERTIAQMRYMGVEDPVFNASFVLRRDQWIEVDRTIKDVLRLKLQAAADLAASSTYGGFDGMAKTTLEYDVIGDSGEAFLDMDVLADGRMDAPLMQTFSIPLPIIHSDFWLGMRHLAVARGAGMPLDTILIRNAARKCAEMLERLVIGTETGLTYGTNTTYHTGTSTIYGYINFPYRITKTDLNTPAGTNANATVQDIIEMRQLLYNANYYGPYMLYHSPDWDAWLDQDYYIASTGMTSMTLRQRIIAIGNILDVRRLDYLPSATYPYTLIMVQMNGEVARMINGMPFTPVQWETMGGMKQNFKIMGIQVPQLMVTNSGVAGIVHATLS